MPEYVMDGSNGTRGGCYLPHKEIFTERSPRSPLNSHSPPPLSTESNSFDLAVDDEAIDTSIDQLYHNICEMQSSDHSPSRHSFLSYGQESRIDSELRFLAAGDYNVMEEEVQKVEDKLHPAAAGNKVFSPTHSIKPSSLQSSVATPRPSFKSRRPKQSSKKLAAISFMTPPPPPPFVGTKLPNVSEDNHGEAEYLGPYLLKQAREIIISGDNYQKALHLALRSLKSFENSASSTEKPNLDYVMCLHVVSALYCRLGRYTEAIPVLEKSIDIPAMDLGHNHALAKFAGCMQLGDTYAMLGQIENSILFYTAGLEIQRQALGENDPRYGETCRYLAEAYVQALQFDEAEKLCQMALQNHIRNRATASQQEAADRRLLGLICDSKGEYERALEHYVLASMAMAANGQNDDVAAIDCNIGDAYLCLARYDEAIFAYQKAVNMFKSSKGENHPQVASVYVRLADLYNKIGKFSESKSYCENALRIYSKPTSGSPREEIGSGLVEISAIYESMNEPDRALQLLQKAIKVHGNAAGQQTIIAGIEAQMGVLHYMLGNYSESYNSLKNATSKFRAAGERKSALFGIALNQMGLACVHLLSINEAADLFEEARSILEAECGPFHADTIGVYSNLAGTYDAMGRTVDAIEILDYVVNLREERLGTAYPDVEDEKRRLAELLKEAGMVRNRRSRSLETLLVKSNHMIRLHEDAEEELQHIL